MPWSDWNDLGRSIKGAPAISTGGPGRLDAFGVDADTNSLIHTSYEGGRWTDWEDLGGTWTSGPAAASWGPGRIDVVIRDTDMALHHRRYNQGWGEWESLGGQFTRENWRPGIGTPGPNHLEVFVIADNGSMGNRLFDGTKWEDWEYYESSFASGPWVISSPGSMVIMASDQANNLQLRLWAEGWTDWVSIPLPSVPDMPALAAASGHFQVEPRNGALEVMEGRIDMFFRAQNGDLSHFVRRLTGNGEVGPESLGGPVTNVAAVSWGPDRLDLLGTRPDGRLLHRAWIPAEEPPPGSRLI